MVKDKHLVIWLTCLSGISSLSAASIMADIFTTKGAAFFAAIVGALNAATATFVAAMKPIQSALSAQPEQSRQS